jgi:hypothetical protein
MKIFVSYSFRDENRWVEDFVVPLIACFGHVPVTGRILDAGPLDEEVKQKIRQCKRVLCFVTRARPRRDAAGVITDYEPPDWVRDEMFLARGAERDALEFRERGVSYGGAAALRPYVDFDRGDLPRLLLDLAKRLAEWPVGPLQLRLSVPAELRGEVEAAALARTLRAKCVAIDDEGVERSSQDLDVRVRDGQLIVLFWIKADPNLSIDIDVAIGPRVLTCQGVSPIVRDAPLHLRGGL